MTINGICGLVLFFAELGIIALVVVLIRAFAATCSCCCQGCYQDSDRAQCRQYSQHNYPYYQNDIFFWYICMSYPTRPFAPINQSNNHCCGAMGCGGCGGGCDCGNNSNMDVGILIVILILAGN